MGRISLAGFALALICVLPGYTGTMPASEPVARIAMPGVEGRIDHMAVDVKGRRLFAAALGNNSVEVIDLAVQRRVRSITGFREPQGIAYLPASDRFIVSSGGDGSCRVFDGQTYRETAAIDCKEDADNVRYDPASGLVYVGYGRGALGVVDLRRQTRAADIPLSGHPESFQLETGGKRIFVNIPSARQIAVIDRQRRAVIATWPVKEAEANFPMALDETRHRLFIGCRKPARLLAIDSETGRLVADLPCVGDADDLFYDAKLNRVYVSGGEGAISVFAQADADRYDLVAAIPTEAGARTSLFVPATGCLYLAVPHRGSQPAAIWVYAFDRER